MRHETYTNLKCRPRRIPMIVNIANANIGKNSTMIDIFNVVSSHLNLGANRTMKSIY